MLIFFWESLKLNLETFLFCLVFLFILIGISYIITDKRKFYHFFWFNVVNIFIIISFFFLIGFLKSDLEYNTYKYSIIYIREHPDLLDYLKVDLDQIQNDEEINKNEIFFSQFEDQQNEGVVDEEELSIFD